MMRRSLICGVSLLAATTVTAYAEIYTWTDDQGTVHFTEDAASVPAKIRKKLQRAADSDATGTETAPEVQPVEGEGTAARKDETGEAKGAERFNFTTRDQWDVELQKQEAAMVKLRQRLDEPGGRFAVARKEPGEPVRRLTCIALLGYSAHMFSIRATLTGSGPHT